MYIVLTLIRDKAKQILRGQVHTHQLFLFPGFKRSGLHAVSFWILGHKANHAFVKNSPQKSTGQGSRMSPTVQTSPLPVLLYPGYSVSVCEHNAEVDSTLSSSQSTIRRLFFQPRIWQVKS